MASAGRSAITVTSMGTGDGNGLVNAEAGVSSESQFRSLVSKATSRTPRERSDHISQTRDCLSNPSKVPAAQQHLRAPTTDI